MPSTKSSAKLMHDLAQELKLNGHDVSIITMSETIEQDFNITIEDGIKVLRVKSGKIYGANKFQRTINEMRISSIIWNKGQPFFKNNSCDLVIWYSPTIFFSSLVLNIKKKYKAKSYLILRDIFPQWALDTGILRKGIIFNYFRKKELQQYHAADIIGVQSPASLKYFKRIALDVRYKIEVLYNWTKLNENIVNTTNFRIQFNLLDKVVFFYGGNIGQAQDMDNIINLAYQLRNENRAHFLIVGDGSEVFRLKKLIFDLKITNINIIDAVEQTVYLSMLSEFDIGLISLDKNFKTPNFPGKMLGYLYFSKPILASINFDNDLQEILQEYNAGLVSINGDNAQLLNNALYLINNPDVRKKMGTDGRLLLENLFSVSNAAKQILSHF
jgi:glycosyltransferase involved in cell wall biosynthesis